MSEHFTSWMIVYSPCINRVENYINLNSSFPTIKFDAIDTIHDFIKWVDYSIEDQYNTPEYINSICSFPGKLGCNLSHQLLLGEIYDTSSTDWNLVLEDDTIIDNIPLFLKDVEQIFIAANNVNAKYIQLYTHPIFIERQQICGKVIENLYKMTHQWGTCAYFIHKDAIPILKKKYPLQENIDLVYNSLISELKSVCWLNPYVKTIGSIDSKDTTSRLGSIIIENDNT